MTANNIAAVSAVAAFLTALAALFTILEIRRQRLAQHRPELVLEDSPFVLYRAGTDDDHPFVVVGVPAGPPPDTSSGTFVVSVRLHNVGRGVAREISARWILDMQAFAERLAPFARSIGGRIWLNGDFVHFESAVGATQWSARQRMSTHLGVLMPAPDGRVRELQIDFAYGQCLAAFYSAACDPRNNDTLDDWIVPPISLQLAYRDLEGTEYTKTVVVTPDLFVLAPSGFGEGRGESYEVGRGQLLARDA